MFGASLLAFLGDSVWVWYIYIFASATGIYHNTVIHLELKKEKKSNMAMILLFIGYMFFNIVALVRNLQ
jgi:hypothetical protein